MRSFQSYDITLELTFPRASNDLLIFPPSRRRAPLLLVAVARSLPARSTKVSFELVTLVPCCCFKVTTKTACDLLDCALASVGCCVRRKLPSASHFINSSGSAGCFSVRRAIRISPPLSRIGRSFPAFPLCSTSKSLMRSL